MKLAAMGFRWIATRTTSQGMGSPVRRWLLDPDMMHHSRKELDERFDHERNSNRRGSRYVLVGVNAMIWRDLGRAKVKKLCAQHLQPRSSST